MYMYLPPMEILVATTCTTNHSPSSSFCSTRKELHAAIHSKSSGIDRVIPLTLPMLHIPHDRHRVIGRASSRGLSSQNHSPQHPLRSFKFPTFKQSKVHVKFVSEKKTKRKMEQ
ncbi:hypothetical protein V8G54_018583 [Vigna mungo]|uniref:Uncharacterized protein n=1 Tax=Vigna mungo TaxID=3915 RepID=A0AAQ3RST7_VIGMU